MTSKDFCIDLSKVDMDWKFLDKKREKWVKNYLGEGEEVQKFIDHINEECPSIVHDRALWKADLSPSHNQVLKECEAIHKTAEKLADELENISIPTFQQIYQQIQFPNGVPSSIILQCVSALRDSSKRVINQIGPKNSQPGRKKDNYRERFIDELVIAYMKAFEKVPPYSKNSGPKNHFHDLVCELLIWLDMTPKPEITGATDREKQIRASIERVRSTRADLF